MKVKLSERRLKALRVKALRNQENDFEDINIDEVGKICLDLGFSKEFEDQDNYTLRDLLEMILEKLDNLITNI